MARGKRLRVGAFQFKGCGSIDANLAAIQRGMKKAARQRVQLLALQECALSGYAGVDIDTPKSIDRAALRQATRAVAAAAKQHKLYVTLGTTLFEQRRACNAVQLIGADGRLKGTYAKRAMYGEDSQHYAPGRKRGVHTVCGVRVGLRICFEFRFPEYFRELLHARVQLAVMGFSMVGTNAKKLPIARAQLATRAAENGLWLLTANNLNGKQNAPTCLIDPDGTILCEAPRNREALVTGMVTLGPLPPLRASILDHARQLRKRP